MMTDEPRTTINVSIETTLGTILVELFVDAAPITVSNFLYYVDQGLYDSGIFHRTVTMENQPGNQVKIEVIQGGIDPHRAAELGQPIPLERTTSTKLKHIDGAISMARSEPDTARGDFFICIGEQPELDFGGRRNPDGQGFAAFGRIADGLDTVRRIHQSPHAEQRLSPPIVIQRIRRISE
jgi:peptidyl-prolyl cis-trans isomerase A (cyclophilin A)